MCKSKNKFLFSNTFISVLQFFVLLTLFSTSSSSSAILNEMNFARFHQNVIFTTAMLFNTTTASSLLDCGKACLLTPGCLTLTFQPRSGVTLCQGHSLRPFQMMGYTQAEPLVETFFGKKISYNTFTFHSLLLSLICIPLPV